MTKVETIKANCTPFNVKVALHRQKDKYYVKLSLNTEIEQNHWLQEWGGFYKFAEYQVRPFYYDAKLTSCTVTSATFFIGTLFSFLKGPNNLSSFQIGFR